jgi:hypothetical protein
MFPYFIKLPNTSVQTVKPREHNGQEFIYVLDGEIELTTRVEGVQVVERLGPGDSCYLDCSAPHVLTGRTRNPYSETSADVIDVFWCPLGEDYLFKLRNESGSALKMT